MAMRIYTHSHLSCHLKALQISFYKTTNSISLSGTLILNYLITENKSLEASFAESLISSLTSLDSFLSSSFFTSLSFAGALSSFLASSIDFLASSSAFFSSAFISSSSLESSTLYKSTVLKKSSF